MSASPNAPYLSDWSAAALAQISGGPVRAAVLMRIATDPVARLWGGFGLVTIPADLIEATADAVYSGMGELLDLPVLNQLINGDAERVTFTLSGTVVSGEIAALASAGADDIRGAVVNIGFFVMDEDWQRLSPVAWLWEGEADSLNVDRAPSGAGPGVVRTLSLSVGSLMTGRRRPGIGYFSDPDQRRRSADDRFCDRVKTYEVGTTKVWPE